MEKFRKRILIFNPASYLGGAERGLLEIIAALEEKYQIKVLHPRGNEIQDKLGEYSVPISLAHFTKISRRGNSLREIFLSLKDLQNLLVKIGELKPDIILSNGIKAHAISALYSLGHPEVHFVPFIRDAVQDWNTTNTLLYSLVKRAADRIIVTTDFLKENYNFGQECSIIPNPVVKTCEVKPHQSMSSENNYELTIGMAAHLAPLKGIEDILLAFRHIRKRFPGKLRLIIAGGNIYKTNKDYYDRYETRIRNLIKRVENSPGEIAFRRYEFSQMYRFYEEIDLLVNCSRAEGFGRSVAEAFFAGKSIVTTATGFWDPGRIEFIRDVVYTPGNIGELVTKVEYSLKNTHKYNKINKIALGEELGFEKFAFRLNTFMESLCT